MTAAPVLNLGRRRPTTRPNLSARFPVYFKQRENRARSLVVIGSADPHNDPGFLRTLPELETVHIENADHGLDIPGNVLGSIDAVHQATAVLDRFLPTTA